MVGGVVGGVLPVPPAHEGIQGFALTTAIGVGQGVATTATETGLEWIFGHGK